MVAVLLQLKGVIAVECEWYSLQLNNTEAPGKKEIGELSPLWISYQEVN